MELIGVGVGPGDPGMVTVSAVRELCAAERVFVPVAVADTAGRAEAVARAHLTHQRLERLVFALSDDVRGPQDRRREHWADAADRVVEHLTTRGGTAAFATLGDPAVYSTFGYLAATVRARLPQVRIRTVPGVTAMQAAASAAGVSLVEGAEPLTLLPLARDDLSAVDDALAGPGAVVAYKGGRHLARLRERVAAAGALGRAWCAEHLGTADERVVPLSEIDTASYLSTVVVLPERGETGAAL